MKHVLVAVLLFGVAASGASEIVVVLRNAGSTDVVVEDRNKSPTAELQPGQSTEVKLTRHQWLKLGQQVYRFDVNPIFRLPKGSAPPTIQLGSDAKLYLIPLGVKEAVTPPHQPKGFPIKPTRKIDLI